MNVFALRNSVVDDYARYVKSFVRIRDRHIREFVDDQMAGGVLWPDPLIQLNPAFEPGESIDEDELIAHVKGKLAAYKAPKRVVTVAGIGRAPNGKVDYKRLKDYAAEATRN